MLAVSDLGVNHPDVSQQLKALQSKLIQAGIKQSKPTAQRIGVGELLLLLLPLPMTSPMPHPSLLSVEPLVHHSDVCLPRANLRLINPMWLLVLTDHDEQPAQQSKLRIQVDQSRVVFGVADTSCSLEYGECFFQPTIDGTPCMLTESFVLVVGHGAHALSCYPRHLI